MQTGQGDLAERLFRQVLDLQPGHLPTLNLYSIFLTQAGRYGEAENYIRLALSGGSRSDATFYNYGIILKALKRPQEALVQFGAALKINAEVAETWNNRGTVLNDLKRHKEAIADFDRAIARDPNYAAAFFNKGNALAELEMHAEALAAYDRALALKPDFAGAWLGRGDMLHKLKRHEEAAQAFATLLKVDPHYSFAKGLLLHQKMICCDWRGVGDLIAEIDRDVMAGRLVAEPFGWVSAATSPRSLQRAAALFGEYKFPATVERVVRKSAGDPGKIRIGYASGEFREHAASHLIVGVLENHDRSQFEIYAIDSGWDDGSEVRRRINAAVHKTIDIRQLNDDAAATVIRDNDIDILVNLNGYFGEDRNGVFARRAAPIQVNYLGFPGTLGTAYIDYIIADRHVIPSDHQEFYTEKVVYLPNCYQANDRMRKIGTHVFTRAECGLPPSEFVFCCFNNNYKILPAVFDGWMRILAEVGDSVLWLLKDNVTAVSNLHKAAAARGVSPERVVFAERMPLSDHLARHRLADLFLDTTPCNAHTTASDALWAGLPVLTQIGETFPGRVAASLLHAVGLAELIASTPRDYEDRAITLASDSDKLAAIKAKLAGSRLTAPLFDTGRFARHIEAAYTAMHERHRAGLPPHPISVAP
jgi:predicted O-linked N-acetylglucosamine transferase (SPINDLY family)